MSGNGRVCNYSGAAYTLFKSLISKGCLVNRETISKLLERHGVAPTPQRLDIAELLLTRPQHLSAEQVLSTLRASRARVSKATIYNTLNLFCERGLLRTVEVDPARIYYDSTGEPHHHFYNVDTGELTDIPLEAVELTVRTDLPPGTHQEGIDVVVRVRSEA
jgi:Fur family iron response transcriptional regulator